MSLSTSALKLIRYSLTLFDLPTLTNFFHLSLSYIITSHLTSSHHIPSHHISSHITLSFPSLLSFTPPYFSLSLFLSPVHLPLRYSHFSNTPLLFFISPYLSSLYLFLISSSLSSLFLFSSPLCLCIFLCLSLILNFF